MPWVKQEKDALVATLRAAGPDAATLDEGWDVRRLVAHLVQREQAPVAMIGDAITRNPPGQEPNLTRLCEQARTLEGYAALVDRFVKGPPRWSPMSWAAEQINFLEYVIHHEDVRRGGPDPALPRVLPDAEQDAVWKQQAIFARTLRKAPTGVVLASPRGQRRVAKKGNGVTVTGEPVELALWLSGRRKAAHVEIAGEQRAVDRFDAWVSTR